MVKLTAAIIRLADALATTKEGNEKERSPYNPLKEKAREETLPQTPSACVRGLDVDGINTCNSDALRPRGRVREEIAKMRERRMRKIVRKLPPRERVRACPEARFGGRSGASGFAT